MAQPKLDTEAFSRISRHHLTHVDISRQNTGLAIREVVIPQSRRKRSSKPSGVRLRGQGLAEVIFVQVASFPPWHNLASKMLSPDHCTPKRRRATVKICGEGQASAGKDVALNEFRLRGDKPKTVLDGEA